MKKLYFILIAGVLAILFSCSLYAQPQRPTGAGWYGGDCHVHTINSDGSGTVQQCIDSAYARGMSFIYITDHNNMRAEIETIWSNAEVYSGDFIAMVGMEVDNKEGHANCYQIPVNIKSLTRLFYSYPVDEGFVEVNRKDDSEKVAKTWQEMIDGINATGGFIMPVHPADKTYPFLNTYSIKNFAGLEVWNEGNGLSESNRQARDYWDDLNTRGECKYVGVFNSDAHNPAHVAITYNMCYLESLTIENINKALKTGASYGTNGPQLRFEIGGATLGQTLKITENKQNVNIHIKAFDEKHPLTKIELYCFKITGEDKNTKEMIKSWDLTDQNLFNWETTFAWEVSANEFYRLEVQSEKAAFTTAVGFACSNPIWVKGK